MANVLTYAMVCGIIRCTMKPQLKQAVERDQKYLAWIRSLPCIRCDRQPSEAHHQPAVGHSSVGLKTSDYRAVPLCTSHHRLLHDSGRKSFWGDTDIEAIISRLNVEFFLRP